MAFVPSYANPTPARRFTPRLVSHTAMSGFGDTLKSIGGGLFGIVAAGEQAKGAQAAMLQQQQMMAMQNQGIFGGSMGMLLLLGGVGLGAFLLLRKKKPATP